MKKLNANTLKIIAVVAMLIDHIAVGFIPQGTALYFIMRFIGRLTAPIMCFFIAEGFYHTHDLKKYIFRLGIFTVLSHVPYRLFFQVKNPLTSSVMLPLLLGLLALWIFKNEKVNRPLTYLGCLACFGLSFYSDWSCMPVFFILLFGIFRDDRKEMLIRFSIVCDIFSTVAITMHPSETFIFGIFLTIPLLAMYSGKLGKKSKALKWGFYLFYPLHLTALYLLSAFI